LTYQFKDIDCSTFTPVYDIGSMKMADASDGLVHILEFRGPGTVYEGPTPHMVQSNACGFLQRENGIAQARRKGWRPPR